MGWMAVSGARCEWADGERVLYRRASSMCDLSYLTLPFIQQWPAAAALSTHSECLDSVGWIVGRSVD